MIRRLPLLMIAALAPFWPTGCTNAPVSAPLRPAQLELQAARELHAVAEKEAAALHAALARDEDELAADLESLGRVRPADSPYLLVDIDGRRVVYYENGRLAKVCEASVGSGKLVEGEKRNWKFETPRGAFSVLGKVKDPIWNKPDWAFVEKGEPVPPWGSPLRQEKGAMGPYALDLGDGYKLHGTREEGRIGDPVSHGCIRLETECIIYFYEHIAVGTDVYMF